MPASPDAGDVAPIAAFAAALAASADGAELVATIARGVHDLTGGSAAIAVRTGDGRFVLSNDLRADDTRDALGDPSPANVGREVHIEPSGRRATIPLVTPAGLVMAVLEVRSATQPLTGDRATLGLIGTLVAGAVRMAEFGAELTARRAAVIELNGVKNDLIAMLAHDFSGPLTTIVGLADVLAEDERYDDESRRLLAMINASATRLASLASDTLEISRLDPHELAMRFDPVDFVRLVRETVRTLGVTRVIDLRSSAPAIVVRADAARMRQVFENLIGNAIKFSPRGEPVDVAVDARAGGVEVTIRDRGIGIPAGELSKLFGRFARGSNARDRGIGGTGFGLYLSRTIVDLHGGRIAVESKVDAGSTFRVFLPDSPQPRRASALRVLVVDDEATDGSFVAQTLREDGYMVRHATDSRTLREALAAQRCDVAIVDGDRIPVESIALLAELATRMPMVAIVGAGAPPIPPTAFVLRKPFLVKEFAYVLEAALASPEPEREPSAS